MHTPQYIMFCILFLGATFAPWRHIRDAPNQYAPAPVIVGIFGLYQVAMAALLHWGGFW